MTTTPNDPFATLGPALSVDETVRQLQNPKFAISWGIVHLPHLHLWNFLHEWNETDGEEWQSNMTKWAVYAYDSSSTKAPVMEDFAPVARWAIEAIDTGRLDPSELYDLLKEWLGGKGMAHWYREDAARVKLAAEITGTDPQ